MNGTDQITRGVSHKHILFWYNVKSVVFVETENA